MECSTAVNNKVNLSLHIDTENSPGLVKYQEKKQVATTVHFIIKKKVPCFKRQMFICKYSRKDLEGCTPW